MRFMKRALLAVFVAAGLAGAGAGNAYAVDGCVGFPDYGGLYYHCMAANEHLPSISTVGTTYVGTEVPAFCYFLGCTAETPVGYSVPVKLTTTRPSSDVTVFQLQYSCYEDWYYTGGRYCSRSYTITYDAPYASCEFNTDDPNLRAYDGYRFTCNV